MLVSQLRLSRLQTTTVVVVTTIVVVVVVVVAERISNSRSLHTVEGLAHKANPFFGVFFCVLVDSFISLRPLCEKVSVYIKVSNHG
jgi:hypothetical protein